jgi:stage II sporulation protein D
MLHAILTTFGYLADGVTTLPMRRFLLLTAMTALALALAAEAAAAPLFVISGRGWGHGIGMSQYGAQGFALNGRTSAQILSHYYPGTTRATRSAQIRVLLASRRSALTIGSTAQFTAGTTTLGAGTWTATVAADGKIKLVKGTTTRKVASPTVFRAGSAPLRLGGDRYRGTITLRASAGLLWALNSLGLDAYVKGVVPQEMPPSWKHEALKAQAVAARSYALAAGGHCSWFGQSVMCPDTSDQVYGGMEAEEPSTNAAVDATAGKVVEHAGAVAVTFFHSTSGGKTAAVHHEWGGEPVPYLTSVDDPHDSISPYHRWGPRNRTGCPASEPDCVYTAAEMGRLIGARGVRDLTVERNASSRVAQVNVVRSSGPSALSGASMRLKLELRSTWFSIGVLRVTPERTRILWDQAVSVAALARGVSGAVLQRRPAGGEWRDVQAISGSETVTLRLRRSNTFRLASPVATGAAVTVNVAARINFAASQPANGSALVGAVRPKLLAGNEVHVQKRRPDGSWRTVATPVVNPDGVFRARFSVTPGVYRAVIVPPKSTGLVRGISPMLTVEAG